MTTTHEPAKQTSLDPTEYATAWGLSQPELRELLITCYRSGDVVSDAQRFFASAEFAETLAILAGLGQPAAAHSKVLDVGCGNGLASYALARAGYNVTGVDISEGELAGLQGARRLIGQDNVHFAVVNSDMDATALPTDFDIIYMRQALHHSDDPVATVTGLSRMLLPGGVFCAIREHVVRNEVQRQQFLANHPFQPITQDEHAYTLAEYHTAFQAAGLVPRVELYPFDSAINFYPGNHEELVAYLSGRLHIDLHQHGWLRTRVLRLLAWKHQRQSDQLYSFFYQKPL